MIARLSLSTCLALLGLLFSSVGAEPGAAGWKPLFNGKNLDGWRAVIGRNGWPDTNHLVQVHDGMVHMYKDAPANSPQPPGYITTEKEYRIITSACNTSGARNVSNPAQKGNAMQAFYIMW